MKSPKPIGEIIRKNSRANHLSAYQQQTTKFRQIHDLLSNLLGDNIAENIAVSNFKNSILYLETSSPAIAAGFKMKHSQALSLIRREYNPGTVTIEIKVNPKMTQKSKKLSDEFSEKPKGNNRNKVPAQAADMFAELADSAKGDLKEKLLKLASHRKAK